MKKVKLWLLNLMYPIILLLSKIYPAEKVERDIKTLKKVKKSLGDKR